METLNKQDDNLTNTHSFFESKEHYLQFVNAWRANINDEGGWSLTCTHHLIYNALRKKDLYKSFSPAGEGKCNARYDKRPYGAYYSARSELGYRARTGADLDRWLKPFGGTVTQPMLQELVKVLNEVELK